MEKQKLVNQALDSFDPSGHYKREQIPELASWDLSLIFTSDEAWEKTFTDFKSELEGAAAYAGLLARSAQDLLAGLNQQEKLYRKAEKLMLYAHLKKDQDQTNQTYLAMSSRVSQLIAELSGKLAFMQPELASIPKESYEQFIASEPKLEVYRQFFDNILRRKAHTLSEKEESLLAKAGDVFDAGAEIFSSFSNADLKFPQVEIAGEAVRISQANFVPLLENRDRSIRQEVFSKYYGTYKQFSNTLALTLQKQVKQDNYLAAVRGHQSARAAALFNNAIKEEVYDQLLATVENHLTLLHDYVSLRKTKLGLSDLHCYDLYVPLLKETDFKFKPSQAMEIVKEALAPLGQEYLEGLDQAFDERWIDWFTNQGKRSGAYSSGSTYDSRPYILLNWQGNLDSLYTLIHELGHSMHSHFSDRQAYINSSYSIFLAEIASTTNENLLTHYLLSRETDPARRLFIINHYLDGFKGTVFRQTQFAKFEHLIHQAEQAGQPLTAAYLNETYGQINREFYGPDLYQDPEISWEWMRIPHFYYNYYVYQYATGFSAATSFARSILAGGKDERDAYLGFLKAGSSDYPLQVLQKAGLDMTKAEPIESALASFKEYLELFKEG